MARLFWLLPEVTQRHRAASNLQREEGSLFHHNKGMVVVTPRGLEATEEKHGHRMHRNVETGYVVS